MIHLLFSFFLLFTTGVDADWKTLSEDAKSLSKQGYHADAAKSYEKAWRSAETETQLLVDAGNEYLKARLYTDASRVYEEALMDGSQSEFLQYKLGIALKGHGQYEAAIAMLSESLQIEATGSYLLQKIIRDEISGCQMAMKPTYHSLATKVNRLNNEINSPASDYAPLAVGSSKLYFASAKSGSAQVYESASLNGNWTTPGVSKELAQIIEGNYGGGSFNKDMTEFYFSICDSKPTQSATGKNCKIFKSSKTARGWNKAVPMREYINWSGSTTSHPTIVYEGDTEVLYFTSNRAGGQGGMDVWYATREVNSSEIDFTFPVNAGPVLNSIKDDVTPYYDRSKGVLYFSSDGHQNAGGLDVFRIKGKRNEWSAPENMGAPVNSSADDYYFSTKTGTEVAFLTSNRLLDNGMKTTADDDIFQIDFSATDIVATTTPVTSTGTVTTASSRSTPNRTSTISSGSFKIKGRVTDTSNGQKIGDTYVTLYKAIGESKRRKIETIKSDDGRYAFDMRPGEYYIVEAYKPGYKLGDFEFNTEDLDSGISIDIPLDRAKGYTSTTRSTTSGPVTSGVPDRTTATTTVASSTYTPSRSTTPTYKPSRPSTTTYSNVVTPSNSATVDTYVAGTEYRIQLTAVGKYNPMLPIFTNARKYGTLGTEMHPNGRLTRIFLRSFNNYDQAKALVNTMKSFGFDTAFVVKYQDGRRVTI